MIVCACERCVWVWESARANGPFEGNKRRTEGRREEEVSTRSAQFRLIDETCIQTSFFFPSCNSFSSLQHRLFPLFPWWRKGITHLRFLRPRSYSVEWCFGYSLFPISADIFMHLLSASLYKRIYIYIHIVQTLPQKPVACRAVGQRRRHNACSTWHLTAATRAKCRNDVCIISDTILF